MSAAQLDMSEQDATFAPAAPAALREQVAARLASHRERRSRAAAARAAEDFVPSGNLTGADHGKRSTRIAAAVAERYAHTQSYRSFLAVEAENATRKAAAAAEVAARNAQAVAAAEQLLLEELDAEAAESRGSAVSFEAAPERGLQVVEADQPVARTSTGGLTVRLYEDVGRTARGPESAMYHASAGQESAAEDWDERQALDEEIAYRQSPLDELDAVSTPIPGNLLEFPRQLVATRKARPRYAEGPLREDADAHEDHAQLRIFEVEAEQIRLDPVVESAAPEWSSIWLDALAKTVPEETAEEAQYSMAQRPKTASLERRVMAAMVDGTLIGMGYVLFATVFAWNAPELPALPAAAMGSAGVLASLYLMYQMLFFTLSEATPGMRYARIGLCTFSDENPTRAAMRGRTLAVLFAACPLGLGFLWACLDDDRLGWHDRISRMYQRSY